MYKKMVIAMICNTLSDFFNEPIVESEIHDFEYDKETHLITFTLEFYPVHNNQLKLERHRGLVSSTGRVNLDGKYLHGNYTEQWH